MSKECGEQGSKPHPKDQIISYLIKDYSSNELQVTSQDLRQKVDSLLVTAQVTSFFKNYIAESVEKAHTDRTMVPKVVAPEKLGLVEGKLGIYDPALSMGIEKSSFMDYRFSISSKMVRVVFIKNGEEIKEGFAGKFGNEDNYRVRWEKEFKDHYNKDLYEGIDENKFYDAVDKEIKLNVEPEFDPDDLNQLRKMWPLIHEKTAEMGY